MTEVIALWTHPRSISTAFERVMIERKDLTVLHEPFSYYYYVHRNEGTIEQEYVDPEHPTAYEDIRDYIIETAADQGPVFFKDMCAHCHDPLMADPGFLDRLTNTFLIRDPARAIPSYYAMNPDVTNEEIGLEQLYRTFQNVAGMEGSAPVVVDATDLENDPEGIMAAYCRAVDIPFIPDALTWECENGHQEEWDIWKEWHTDAAQSTGIQKDMEVFDTDTENNDHLKRLYDIQYPFYEALYRHRIKPAAVHTSYSTVRDATGSV